MGIGRRKTSEIQTMITSFLKFIKQNKLPLNRESLQAYCRYHKHLDNANSKIDWIPLPFEKVGVFVCEDFECIDVIRYSQGVPISTRKQFVFKILCTKCGTEHSIFEQAMYNKITKNTGCSACNLRARHKPKL